MAGEDNSERAFTDLRYDKRFAGWNYTFDFFNLKSLY